MTTVRIASVAGMFYPEIALELRDSLQGLFQRADKHAAEKASATPMTSDIIPKVLIAPHAGFVYSGMCAAMGYRLWRHAPFKRVLLLGPAHKVAVLGAQITAADFWQSPLGPVAIDQALRQRLLQYSFVNAGDDAHMQEHCLEVHVPFLQHVLGEFALVPLVVGASNAQELEQMLALALDDPQTGIVISSDLSHFHPDAHARELDETTAQAIEQFQWEKLTGKHACGHMPLSGMLELARNRQMSIERIWMCNSSDHSKDTNRVVGYGCWALDVPKVA